MRRHDLAGIDLSVSRPSSTAIFGDCIELLILPTEDIVEELTSRGISLVAIDSPLNLTNKPYRDVERVLLSRGYRLLPLNMKGMRELAIEGIKLKEKLEAVGIEVIETHPRSARLALGFHNVSDFSKLIMKYLKLCSERNLSKDDIDAITCLLVSLLYRYGKAEIISGKEGTIVLPASGIHLDTFLANLSDSMEE